MASAVSGIRATSAFTSTIAVITAASSGAVAWDEAYRCSAAQPGARHRSAAGLGGAGGGPGRPSGVRQCVLRQCVLRQPAPGLALVRARRPAAAPPLGPPALGLGPPELGQ